MVCEWIFRISGYHEKVHFQFFHQNFFREHEMYYINRYQFAPRTQPKKYSFIFENVGRISVCSFFFRGDWGELGEEFVSWGSGE